MELYNLLLVLAQLIPRQLGHFSQVTFEVRGEVGAEAKNGSKTGVKVKFSSIKQQHRAVNKVPR